MHGRADPGESGRHSSRFAALITSLGCDDDQDHCQWMPSADLARTSRSLSHIGARTQITGYRVVSATLPGNLLRMPGKQRQVGPELRRPCTGY